MDDVSYLIQTTDIFIFFAYSLFGYAIIRFIIFRNEDKHFYLTLKLFFGLKIISAIIMSLLTVFYWKVGDAISYFNEGENLIQLLKKDISNIKYFFLPVEFYSSQLKIDNELVRTVNGAGQEASFFISKLCALFYPLAMGKYLLVNFFFCFISIIAQLKLYIIIVKRYPHLKRIIAVCILFMPTLLLYSSTIYKETICYSCICFAINNLYNIKHNSSKTANYIFLIINVFFIFITKHYIISGFLIAAFLLLFFQFITLMLRHSIITRFMAITLLIVVGTFLYYNLEIFNPYILSFVDTSNTFQEYYNNDFGETSSFKIGEIEMSVEGLVKKMPIGFYSTYFRPHVWEVRKPIVLFSAIESCFILSLTLYTLVFKGRYIFELVSRDLFARMSLYYSIVLGIIIGLTTFNFGTLIRYKVPVVPFAWLFVFILLYYVPTKKKLT